MRFSIILNNKKNDTIDNSSEVLNNNEDNIVSFNKKEENDVGNYIELTELKNDNKNDKSVLSSDSVFNLINVEGIPDNQNYGEYNVLECVKLKSSRKKIKGVYTNNDKCIKITADVTKTLFQKKIIYTIQMVKPGSGFIKITFENDKHRIFGIFINDEHHDEKILNNCSKGGFTVYKNKNYVDKVKLGSLSQNIKNDTELWSSVDIQGNVKNKNINALYFNLLTHEDIKFDNIVKCINMCNELGVECKFVYSFFHNEKGVSYRNYSMVKKKYEDKQYMVEYLNNFNSFIDIIKKYYHPLLKLSVIFEPYLLSNIYKYNDVGKLNPKKIFVNYPFGHEKGTNFLTFYKHINKLCDSSSINLVNVFNIEILNKKINKISLKDYSLMKFIDDIKDDCYLIARFYNFFINSNHSHIAFDKYHLDGGRDPSKWLWNNDEWLCFLYIVKTITDHINQINISSSIHKVKAILYEMPVGHINNIMDKSLYTNKPYENHTNTNTDYEDTTSLFLFGGCFKPLYSKFYNNLWNDTGLRTDNSIICYKEHVSLCEENNIEYILFGAGCDLSTSHIYSSNTGKVNTDHYYTLSKFSEFNKE